MRDRDTAAGWGRWLVGGVGFAVLALFGTVLWYAYLEGLTGAHGAPPLVRADPRPWRVAPGDRGGIQVANAQSSVVDVFRSEPRVRDTEELVPPSPPEDSPATGRIGPALDTVDGAPAPAAALPNTSAPDAVTPDLAGLEALASREPDAAGPVATLPAPATDADAAPPTAGDAGAAPRGGDAASTSGLVRGAPVPSARPRVVVALADEAGADEARRDGARVAAPADSGRESPGDRDPLPAARSARGEEPTGASGPATRGEVDRPPARGPATERPAASAPTTSRAPDGGVQGPEGPRRLAALPRPDTPAAAEQRPPPRSGTVWRLQLAALRTEDAVPAAWTELRARYAELGALGATVERAQTSGGTVYRLQAGPFGSRDRAIGACATIRARGGQCFIVAVAQ